MFSKACEYGIRASVHIAMQSELGLRVGLKDISKAIDSPEAFTAKILQQLTRSDIIQSSKGPTGGFEMSDKQLSTVKLSDIVKTLDSDLIYTGCGLGLPSCDENNPCALHFEFKEIRDQLRKMLETTSIRQLAKTRKIDESYIKN